MKDILGIICAAIGFAILFVLIIEDRGEPRTFVVVSDETFAVQQAPIDSNEPPSTLVMPEPIKIQNIADLSKISDLKIKSYIRKNASFRKEDNILFFEWRGHSDEKLVGEKIKLENDSEIYVIKYHYCDSCKEKDTMVHRQVFIIPKDMQYKMEMENILVH